MTESSVIAKWTERGLVFVAAERLLGGESPEGVVAFLVRNAKNLEQR